ncbi:Ribulose bisphosphate carboxylase small chain, chloroplastic [Zostera marina]|uniref:Ribulose bisphosphate carboxylase small subunit, chloroplastic n=1 Tax=Zostera marina TaxID=29655 RepID=A0A0K9PUU1_ZOSMR|nr:Ribulose bisphosphate carboxylase small chain, chloroplastic [Zostera marina]
MASSMMVSSAATMARSSPAQTSMVAPFTGLKSSAAFPISRKTSVNFSTLPSNGGRVQCMEVWPPEGLKKFETFSYLPPFTDEQLIKEVDYLIRNGWVPCIEFAKEGFIFREHGNTPGYYDGRYWTMWKLPMFGCTDATQVLNEVQECKKAYPDYFSRIIGFDNKRQVQCVSFVASKPVGYE